MKKIMRDYLKLLRPRQWIKNFAIFAAILFSGLLFNGTYFKMALYGFVVFCLLSSSIYIINDIFDIHNDKLHPFKRFRPLAHGDIPISIAIIIAIILAGISLIASYNISLSFFMMTGIYLIMQLSYSIFLKHIAVVDILVLASGYILRVYAGEVVIGFQYHISVWLLLTAISLSLFLAVGKRKRELALVSEHNTATIAAVRKSLSHYSERLLDVYASIFATSTFISYALFTFLENSSQLQGVSNDVFMPQFLPPFMQRKWLMVTIIPVVYGLMRYLQDIYEKHEGESPERVLFTDKPLLATVVIWMVLVFIIIYIISGVL
jgi:decaprenyl-phosphate phosphoribosyltransferase